MEAAEIFRLIFGFVAVLGMIGAAAWAARKLGLASMAGAAAGARRLSILEMLPLDARRRLVIVKCDDTEYLLVLGPSGETVVDMEIPGAAAGADTPPLAQSNPFAKLTAAAAGLKLAKKDAA